MGRLFYLERLSWYARLPIKWAILGIVVAVVCYPNPSRFVKHLKHWRDPSALIEPDADALQPLARELKRSLPPALTAPNTLRHVEAFVYERVPYEWDWNTWGTADYLPTVQEVLEKGREDCDGRAVLAASLLAGLGFQAEIVTDFAHVWVKTNRGETMGPGKRKAVVATERGLEVDWRALAGLPRAMAYGIAVFPQTRELVVLMAAWLLLLSARTGLMRSVAALCLLVLGLYAVRLGGEDYRNPSLWLQWVGVGFLLGGVVIPLRCVRTKARSSETVVAAR